jgi:uncharacterized membrane protein YgcG
VTNFQGCLFRRVATRSVIAALPVAMTAAYASGLFVQPPRLAAQIDYVPVAEITVAPTTVGIADSPLYGMSRADIDKQLDEMLSLGVTNIRVFVPWAFVEPADNQYDWSHIQDVMDAAAARNMGVLAEINATPLWADSAPGIGSILFPGSGIPKVSAFVDFVKAFVGKYAGTVSAYEIWNEPNYIANSSPINPEAYAALLQAVYPVIKDPVSGLDKTATVIAGALGTVQTHPLGLTMSPVEYVQRMLAAGAMNSFDALSIHPYNEEIPITGTCATCPSWMLTPQQQLDVIKTLIDGKKIWITEYGLPTTPVDGGFTEQDQATWLKDMLDYWQTFGSQAGPIFFYNTRDVQPNSTDPQNNYGLFYNNWDPKAAATMLKDWIAAHLVLPPTNPVALNPIAQFLAAIQQAFQSFSQALSQLFNPLSFVQSFFQAITSLFGFGAPAPAAVVTTSNTVAPSAARMALAKADLEPSIDTGTGSGTASETHAGEAASAVAVAVEPAVEPAAQPEAQPEAEPKKAESGAAQTESPDVPQAVSETSVTDANETATAPKVDSATTVSDTDEDQSKTTSGATSAAKTEAADATPAKPEKTSTEKSGAEKTGTEKSGTEKTSSASAASDNDKPKAGSDSAGGGSSSSSSSGSSSGSSGGSGSSE